jgi:hypothetical protein
MPVDRDMGQPDPTIIIFVPRGLICAPPNIRAHKGRNVSQAVQNCFAGTVQLEGVVTVVAADARRIPGKE